MNLEKAELYIKLPKWMMEELGKSSESEGVSIQTLIKRMIKDAMKEESM